MMGLSPIVKRKNKDLRTQVALTQDLTAINLILGEFLPGITCSVRYAAHISSTNNKAYHMTSLFGQYDTKNEPYLEKYVT